MDPTKVVCALCGDHMTLKTCGSASVPVPVPGGGGWRLPLCHHDTHSCYRRWTVYGERRPFFLHQAADDGDEKPHHDDQHDQVDE